VNDVITEVGFWPFCLVFP